MRYYVVIPAYNEEAFLELTLDSLMGQSLQPAQVVVVDDNSTDSTADIIGRYAARYTNIREYTNRSDPGHASGAKVVSAFYSGLDLLDADYDFLVKLDADIVLPENYFMQISQVFSSNANVGIAGGFAYEEDSQGRWALNHPMNKDHVRGGFKSYSAACFKAIGGLKPAIGWDTVDELLARYHGFEVITLDHLKVKHLRPLGSSYSKQSWIAQGEALYRMRYGWLLAVIATLKMALKHKKPQILFDNFKGYTAARKSQTPYLVSEDEGEFIRRYRWKNIRRKLF